MAENFVNSVVTRVAEQLVDLTISQGQYLFCTEKIIENLEETRDELRSKREAIEDRVQQAKERTEIIEKPVENWLNKVRSLLEEAERLCQEMEGNDNCFLGYCPPWKRYHIARQMVEKTTKMTKLINTKELDKFSHLAPLQRNYYNSNKNYTHVESTESVFRDLSKALQDDDTHMIGLHGMGGSGKTSLATEVGKWAKETNLVDLVLTITVSQDPIVTNIQEKLAEKLNLTLEVKFEEDRAERLWLRLKDEKVLIIVDDLWERFDLKRLGIDFDRKDGGMCKVLLTSRRERVCALMDCQVKFQLKPLSEEEAWTLFRKFAGIDDQFPSNLSAVATDVARECKGLPIALKAVGSSLKGIRECQANEWKLALRNLRAAKPIDGEEEKGAIRCLKLSYDYLRNKDAELLFLMCAVFPEDHEIPFEDLVRYGAGLGLGGEFGSFDGARTSIIGNLRKLIDFGLLLSFEGVKYYVKMHDLARDTAVYIASEKNPIIMENHGKGLNSLARDKVKQCFAISLWGNETDQLPCRLEAPELVILIVNTRSSLDLSSASFEFMKKIKVIAIMYNDFFSVRSISLPQSMQSLTNLKTLRLRGWRLVDISFIWILEGLEVLDLQLCIFNEVPDEIEKLRNLKLLDLRHTVVKDYNSKAIGGCSQLEEFYVSAAGDSRNNYECHPPRQCFVHDVTPMSLQRYDLKLGGLLGYMGHLERMDSIDRVLGLKEFDVSALKGSEKNLLQKAEYVRFDRLCGGPKNIVPDIDLAVGCMNELNRLDLLSCSDIECLFDATSNHGGSFPIECLFVATSNLGVSVRGNASLRRRLIGLRLEEMENLTEVCHGEPPLDFFEKLEEMYVSRCPQLHNIFPRQCSLGNLKILNISGSYDDRSTNCRAVVLFSMIVAKNMQQLEELTIEGCPELRCVITSDAEDGANTREEISVAANNSHLLFPSLKKLRISRCRKMQVIFSVSFVEQNEIQIILPHLQEVIVVDLDNLLEVLPQNYALRWPSLRTLEWRNCPKLTSPWIGLELGQQARPGYASLPCSLITLRLEGMENLTEVCRGEPPFDIFKKLGELYISSCPQLHNIFPRQCNLGNLKILNISRKYDNGSTNCRAVVLFSMIVAKNMQQLEELTIERCPELRHVITSDAGVGANTREEISRSANNSLLLFPRLKKLRISRCSKMQVIFSFFCVEQNEIQIVLPHLEEFILVGLENLLEVLPQNYASGWPSVRKLEWRDCPKLTIPCFGRELRQQTRQGNASLPCRLITLRLEGMENFVRGEPSLDFFKKLEELYISSCPELHNIFPRQCNLGNLKILNISDVFDRSSTIRRAVSDVFDCSSTNCRAVVLFSMIVAKYMQQLEELTIEGCPELRHVITSDAEDGANTREEISLFANNSHLLFPSLKKLRISRCPKMQVIFSISCVKQNEIEIVLPHLQEFILVDLENLLELLPQNYASRWPSLRTLEWRNCPKLTTPWIGLELRQQDVVPDEDHQKPLTLELQTLSLTKLPDSMMKWFGSNGTQILTFQFLQQLEIGGLKKMISMDVLRGLSNLESLGIKNCDELVEIIAENEESKSFAPIEVLFPKLSYLRIQGCNKLKNLFSITGSFGQSSEGNIDNETEIVVPNLKEIGLEKLPNFVNICQGFMMHKVKLKVVRVSGCPKFTPELGVTQSIPLDHRVEEKVIVWRVALTVNQLCRQQMCPVALKFFLSIEKFHLGNSGVEGILLVELVEEGRSNNVAQKPLNSNLEELYLYELTELRFIWSGPTQFLEFHKLTDITVNGCPKLKTLFPSGIVGSLQNLQSITIWNCEEMEEIIELQDGCFPEMRDFLVAKCNKLKCIFYADCMDSRHYASLRFLNVRKCSQLQRIYGLKCTIEANNEDHGKQEVLLELNNFILESLPNFTEIGHGIKLKKRPGFFYRIKECPKYIQQFADCGEDVAGSSQL